MSDAGNSNHSRFQTMANSTARVAPPSHVHGQQVGGHGQRKNGRNGRRGGCRRVVGVENLHQDGGKHHRKPEFEGNRIPYLRAQKGTDPTPCQSAYRGDEMPDDDRLGPGHAKKDAGRVDEAGGGQGRKQDGNPGQPGCEGDDRQQQPAAERPPQHTRKGDDPRTVDLGRELLTAQGGQSELHRTGFEQHRYVPFPLGPFRTAEPEGCTARSRTAAGSGYAGCWLKTVLRREEVRAGGPPRTRTSSLLRRGYAQPSFLRAASKSLMIISATFCGSGSTFMQEPISSLVPP